MRRGESLLIQLASPILCAELQVFSFYGRPSSALIRTRRLREMISTVRHRGPDDEGLWSDGTCGLAHARLAIIDLSPGGHQPMADADGRIWVTYNGEIYNFKDLRRELRAWATGSAPSRTPKC